MLTPLDEAAGVELPETGAVSERPVLIEGVLEGDVLPLCTEDKREELRVGEVVKIGRVEEADVPLNTMELDPVPVGLYRLLVLDNG